MSLFNGRYQSPQKSDGTVNAGGKVYFYITGTSTLKDTYSNESLVTPNTNPVILDSAGSALIFLGSGSYDWKVDDSDDNAVVTSQGPVTKTASSVISGTLLAATSWTVDGVGGTDTTFTTIALAMAEARNWVIMGGGGLTINVDAGTYTDDVIDFSHPQGQFITLAGSGSGSCTLIYSATSLPVVHITGGITFGGITGFTIDQPSATTGHPYAVTVDEGSTLLSMTNVIIQGDGSTIACLQVVDKSVVLAGSITVKDFLTYGIRVASSSYVKATATTIDNTTLGGGTAALTVTTKGQFIAASRLAISGGTTEIANGILCTTWGWVQLVDIDIDECDDGIVVINGGTVYVQDASPTFTNITGSNYNVTEDTLDTGTTAQVGTLIFTT